MSTKGSGGSRVGGPDAPQVRLAALDDGAVKIPLDLRMQEGGVETPVPPVLGGEKLGENVVHGNTLAGGGREGIRGQGRLQLRLQIRLQTTLKNWRTLKPQTQNFAVFLAVSCSVRWR